jgi:hypothetical protein
MARAGGWIDRVSNRQHRKRSTPATWVTVLGGSRSVSIEAVALVALGEELTAVPQIFVRVADWSVGTCDASLSPGLRVTERISRRIRGTQDCRRRRKRPCHHS